MEIDKKVKKQWSLTVDNGEEGNLEPELGVRRETLPQPSEGPSSQVPAATLRWDSRPGYLATKVHSQGLALSRSLTLRVKGQRRTMWATTWPPLT